MAQNATTGNLEAASKIIIAAARYTEEHNAPAMALIESFSLASGSKQVTVPKVGQMTVSDLADGVDIVDEEDIGMTTVDLTASEVGAKVILTDKLIREQQNNVFTIIGNDVYILHHPNSVAYLSKEAATVAAAASNAIPDGYSADLLKNFWSGLRPMNNVPIFEDGNLSVDSDDDATGVIASKGAMAVLNSVETRQERQRDASLRATEVVMTSDYGVFELDDSKGAGFILDAAALATNN